MILLKEKRKDTKHTAALGFFVFSTCLSGAPHIIIIRIEKKCVFALYVFSWFHRCLYFLRAQPYSEAAWTKEHGLTEWLASRTDFGG